jgi:hypothetical protein
LFDPFRVVGCWGCCVPRVSPGVIIV